MPLSMRSKIVWGIATCCVILALLTVVGIQYWGRASTADRQNLERLKLILNGSNLKIRFVDFEARVEHPNRLPVGPAVQRELVSLPMQKRYSMAPEFLEASVPLANFLITSDRGDVLIEFHPYLLVARGDDSILMWNTPGSIAATEHARGDPSQEPLERLQGMLAAWEKTAERSK